VELITSRLILREAEHRDALALASYQRDPRYLEHYLESPDSQRIVELSRLWAAELPRLNYQLIITLGPATKVIGCAGLRQAGYPPGEAEVGIELDPEYWGAGYAREVLSALVEFADPKWALNGSTL
jgi:[ribosomal protein S5]-alanine N-acetyltransferase